jgi:hypothetical protein
MHKKGTPRWYTRELREREAQIGKTKRAWYVTRENADVQYVIATRLDMLEGELAAAADRTCRNMQRKKGSTVERPFGEDEQAGHRKP